VARKRERDCSIASMAAETAAHASAARASGTPTTVSRSGDPIARRSNRAAGCAATSSGPAVT